MKITNFNKKESDFTKFINKYLGAKYSIVFIALKNVMSEKPTLTGTISGFIFIYTTYFMLRYSKWIWILVAAYVLSYAIKVAIKIIKLKKSKHKSKTNDNGKDNIRIREKISL